MQHISRTCAGANCWLPVAALLGTSGWTDSRCRKFGRKCTHAPGNSPEPSFTILLPSFSRQKEFHEVMHRRVTRGENESPCHLAFWLLVRQAGFSLLIEIPASSYPSTFTSACNPGCCGKLQIIQAPTITIATPPIHLMRWMETGTAISRPATLRRTPVSRDSPQPPDPDTEESGSHRLKEYWEKHG